LHREAALQGRLQADLPSLAVARVFTGEAWQIDGALQAELTLGGTLNAPSWSGAISGRDLMAVQQALGMRLDRGVLRASLADNRIDIEQLIFRSSQGRVLMSGVLRSDERSEARILLERLPIPLGPGQRLVLSGEAQARLGPDGLILTGQLRADEGVIEISSASTPTLAPDVRVRSAGAPSVLRPTSSGLTGSLTDTAAAAPAERGGSSRGLRVQSDLQIDLGEQLRVHGAGLETRLVGQLRLSGQLPDAVRVEGRVQTRAGVWRGFGQDLQIERGTLVFTGELEDPAIDVVAWRRYQPVEAGVELSGTARRPLLTLVSRPEVPDPDKLSWLVLGTAFDTTRGGQNAALQAAAAVLVAGTDAASPIRNIASNFGLDLLTLRTAPAGASDAGAAGSFAQDSIVTLGKRLTERLFLSYEQSLRGLQNLFRLQYQINERLNVRARAGSQTGVDLIWSRRYD
jgi:translocation and assembly module TamB